METKTIKNSLIVRMVAVAFFLTVSTVAYGQHEEIRSAEDFMLCDTSIIRAKGGDSALIYNRNNQTTFMMMTSGQLDIDTWYLDSGRVAVNDFEIYHKTAYFCGYKSYNGTRKAIFGSFLLDSFECASNFTFLELDTCTELKKIDLYLVDEGMQSGHYELHVAMIGCTEKRANVLVDYVVSSSFIAPPFPIYNCGIYFSNDETESFDDIAATDNYVVVSTRRKMEGIPIIDFWQFEIPSLIGYDFLSSNISHVRLGSPVAETPVVLEHTHDDSYAATFKIDGYSKMAMLLHKIANPGIKCVEILGDDARTLIPMDLKYNKKSYAYDILARNEHYRDEPDSRYNPMQIYHVDLMVIHNWTTYGNGTYYPDKLLWSIDPTNTTYYYVASGENSWLPVFFRYRHDQWNTCPSRFEYRFETGDLKYSTLEDAIVELRRDLKLVKAPARKHTIRFPYVCEGRQEQQ